MSGAIAGDKISRRAQPGEVASGGEKRGNRAWDRAADTAQAARAQPARFTTRAAAMQPDQLKREIYWFNMKCLSHIGI